MNNLSISLNHYPNSIRSFVRLLLAYIWRFTSAYLFASRMGLKDTELWARFRFTSGTNGTKVTTGTDSLFRIRPFTARSRFLLPFERQKGKRYNGLSVRMDTLGARQFHSRGGAPLKNQRLRTECPRVFISRSQYQKLQKSIESHA